MGPSSSAAAPQMSLPPYKGTSGRNFVSNGGGDGVGDARDRRRGSQKSFPSDEGRRNEFSHRRGSQQSTSRGGSQQSSRPSYSQQFHQTEFQQPQQQQQPRKDRRGSGASLRSSSQPPPQQPPIRRFSGGGRRGSLDRSWGMVVLSLSFDLLHAADGLSPLFNPPCFCTLESRLKLEKLRRRTRQRYFCDSLLEPFANFRADVWNEGPRWAAAPFRLPHSLPGLAAAELPVPGDGCGDDDGNSSDRATNVLLRSGTCVLESVDLVDGPLPTPDLPGDFCWKEYWLVERSSGTLRSLSVGRQRPPVDDNCRAILRCLVVSPRFEGAVSDEVLASSVCYGDAATATPNTSTGSDNSVSVGTSLLLADPYVNVWEFRLDPAEHCAYHTHRLPYLFTNLSDSITQELNEAGKPVGKPRRQVVGQTVSIPESQLGSHGVQNVGETTFLQFIVEFKQHVDGLD